MTSQYSQVPGNEPRAYLYDDAASPREQISAVKGNKSSRSPTGQAVNQHKLLQPGILQEGREDVDPPISTDHGFAPIPDSEGKQEKIAVRTWSRTLSRIWIKEVLAFLISLGCQIALVVILLRMSGQRFDTWTFGVSLNAMIATLTTISKSTLMLPVAECISQLKWLHIKRPRRIYDFELFDKASRGPDGSLRMLLSRPFHVASLGCLITVVASAIGPFTQQVISFDTRTVASANDSVSFGYTYAYNTGGNNERGSFGFDITTVDLTLRGAVLKGLYNFDLTPDFNCPGSCAWNGSWVTLGFDYDCKDVSKETFSARQCTKGKYTNETTTPNNDIHNGYDCVMKTPQNLTLIAKYGIMDTMTVQYLASVNRFSTNSYYILDSGPNFMVIAQYSAGGLFDGGGDLWERVTECVVSLTAWELTGASSQGQEFAMNKTRIPLVTKPVELKFNETATGVLTFSQDNLPEPFNISTWDWANLAETMQSNFNNVSAIVGDAGYTNWMSASPLFSKATSGADIEIWLPRIVQALTDAVRSGPNKRLAHGYNLEPVIFVQVNWVWYIIPAITEILASLFLVITVWLSRSSSGVPLWRSSALAPLFHEVYMVDDNRTNFVARTEITDMQELKELAKRWRINIS